MNRTNLSRRRFLAGSGIGAAGLARGVSAEGEQAAPDRGASGRKSDAQSVFITSGETPLAQAIAERLSRRYRVRLTAQQDVQTDFPLTRSALEADEATTALAFHVNTRGCYHVMRAAVVHGIRRVINTGPHFTVAGPRYQRWDHGIGPDVPPHPGTGLYPITKSLGQEICRSFTEVHDVHVLEFLFYSLRDKEQLRAGAGGAPFVVSWTDAGEASRLGLQIDLARLPSKCEVFFIFADVPQAVFLNDKAKRVLGFAPRDDVSLLWRKPR